MQTLERRHLRWVAVGVALVAVAAAGWWLTTTLSGGGERVHEEPWSVADGGPQPPSVSADGRTVTVYFEGGGCYKSSDHEVEETRTSVIITVTVTDYSDNSCASSARLLSEAVQLREPLGSRELVDGAAD